MCSASATLPVGAMLDVYQIEGVLGTGGFGITYKARDTYLGMSVAIKEYFPSDIVARTDGITVTVTRPDYGELFSWGLNRFIGEGQILGQTRAALNAGQEIGTVGPALNVLFQQALRVGKRARAETGIDRAAPSLVTAALDRSRDTVGDLSGKRVLVVGAGSMAGLATSTVAARGAASVTVVNRTSDNADRLAQEYGARSATLAELAAELAVADVVVSCTGAIGILITRDLVAAATVDGRDLSILDLALPHDVDPAVADLPGVSLVSLADLADELRDSDAGHEVEAVRRIVTQEVAAFLSARRQAGVTPTVVALRSMATSVVDAEMERLTGRLPDLDDSTRAEVLHTVRRVADKLLHQPTVRVRELANEAGAVSYATALAELFALDPESVDAVTRPEGLA